MKVIKNLRTWATSLAPIDSHQNANWKFSISVFLENRFCNIRLEIANYNKPFLNVSKSDSEFLLRTLDKTIGPIWYTDLRAM